MLSIWRSGKNTGIPRVMLKIVIQEVLWSIRGSDPAIWSLPLMNVKWHSDPWPWQTFHQFNDLYTELGLPPIMSVFNGAFETGMASQQVTLTLPDNWFFPHFGNLVLSRFCLDGESDFGGFFCLFFFFIIIIFCCDIFSINLLPGFYCNQSISL